MTGILNALIAGVSGAVKDTYFNLVSLLLPGNGTNGAQNNTFLDGSSNTFTITRNPTAGPNAPTQGTFSPFSQTGWGAYFDGSNDYVSVANSAALDLSTADFCIGFWVYLTAGGTFRRVMQWQNGSASNSNYGYTIHIESSNQVSLRCYSGTTGYIITNNTAALQISAWNWVCVTRSGTSGNVYVNGTGVSGTLPTTINNPTSSLLYISGDLGSSDPLLGYLSGLQIVKGSTTALSTTAPTSPYTAVSGTSLLTFQYNRFRDASSNTLTVTPNNGVAITPFSPFAPTSSYSAAAVGGSGYFDGSGDYLQFTDTSNSLDLGGIQASLEFWVYLTNTTVQNLFSKGGMNSGSAWSTTDGAEYAFAYNSGILYFTVNNAGGTLDLTGNFTTNQWNHVVIATNTSNAISMYINGTRTDTDTNAITKPTTRTTVRIGTFLLANWVYGYMCGIRHVTGSSAYDPTLTSITVPTSPPTVVSGTQFLCNFTNAGVVDATAKNVLETVGNAQISTTQSKWGGGSMYFNGTTDYLVSSASLSEWIAFHNGGPFTIDLWFYTGSTASMTLLGTDAATATTGFYLAISDTAARDIAFYVYRGVGGSVFFARSSGSVWSLNTWNYVTVTMDSSKNLTIYINGSSVATASGTSFSFSSGNASYPLAVGRFQAATPGGYFNGYIDDLRMTKGVVRSATTPTAPFPVQ
jgi:hypothetical protein